MTVDWDKNMPFYCLYCGMGHPDHKKDCGTPLGLTRRVNSLATEQIQVMLMLRKLLGETPSSTPLGTTIDMGEE